MNIDIQVLATMECCQDISPDKNIADLCRQLTQLFAVLSENTDSLAVSEETLKCFFTHGGELVVALDKDQKILGMGWLVLVCKGNKMTARIEDVVVDESCRGQGIGRRIMDTLVELALNHQVSHIDLTSHPRRMAANALYQELGFKKGETNVYRLVLNT
jgi:ribosomal protein S18 acetylase RimI-like enzyme